eukprot:1357876-Pyramimonas_sp.AAC.1
MLTAFTRSASAGEPATYNKREMAIVEQLPRTTLRCNSPNAADSRHVRHLWHATLRSEGPKNHASTPS